MKLGVSAFAWTAKFDRSHLRLVPLVKRMGFSAFEIAMFDPANLPVKEIRRAFEADELECTVCAILPTGINPISPDTATRRKSVQHLIRCIETAAALGARLLGGPLYAPIGYLPEHRPSHEEWAWAVEAFQSIGDTLDACKVTLSVEPVNRSETFFLRTAKEAKSLCEAVGHPRIGVTIDTFHANIEERNIAEAVTSLGPFLKHIHVSENDRGLLGKGHVDFKAILAALRESDYHGYLMIEGFGYSPQEEKAPGILWADISVSPEEIASSGAQYLSNILKVQNRAER
jgi:D-psicose/D-tagatose/L-ribulose 3-epimerase